MLQSYEVKQSQVGPLCKNISDDLICD